MNDIQRALDSGQGIIRIPAGEYRVDKPLRIRSNTSLVLDDNAIVIAEDGCMARRGDFLLSNADIDTGNENITVMSGVWDGNFRGNPKSAMYDENGYSGAMLNFVNVKNLRLSNMTLRNAAGYFSRFARLSGFVIEDISFAHDTNIANNDGVHLAGFCENGAIRRVRCLTYGTTRDDLVALNADDCVTRTENRDTFRGPIRNVLVEDVSSERCHCLVRLLSVTAEISDVTIRNLRGGCRSNAVNMDAARYCRAPIVALDDPAYTRGVGNIRNVTIEGMTVTQAHDNPLVLAETNAAGFVIRGFERVEGSEGETLLLRNLSPSRIQLRGLSEAQLAQLLADSKLARYAITHHAGTCDLDVTTDYHDTLILREGGFALFRLDPA